MTSFCSWTLNLLFLAFLSLLGPSFCRLCFPLLFLCEFHFLCSYEFFLPVRPSVHPSVHPKLLRMKQARSISINVSCPPFPRPPFNFSTTFSPPPFSLPNYQSRWSCIHHPYLSLPSFHGYPKASLSPDVRDTKRSQKREKTLSQKVVRQLDSRRRGVGCQTPTL